MKPGTQRFATALLAILVLAGAFVVFFDLVEPAYENLQTLKGKVAGLQDFLATENATIAQAQKIAKAYQGQADAESAVSEAFPIGEDVSGAIAQLYGIAQTNDIALSNVSVSVSAPAPELAITSVGANGIMTAGASIVKPTGTIAFSLAASGNYESFKNFLSQLETNVRIFDVKQVSIQPGLLAGGVRSGTSTLSQDFFDYSMTVAAYYQGQ